MNGTIDVTTLIFLVVAVLIFFKLRSVLGRRTGNERPPYDPYSAKPANKNGEDVLSPERGSDNVIPLPGNQRSGSAVDTLDRTQELQKIIRKFAPEGSLLEKSLMAIVGADARFDPGEFLKGAKSAYELIVMAFAEGNKRLLKQLLSGEVYDGFESAIKDREKKGHIVDSSFVGIDSANIMNAELKNKTAHVTVKFVSQLITATLNSDGKVIDGDPKKVREVTDIWTFAREVTSRDLNWKLVATEAAS